MNSSQQISIPSSPQPIKVLHIITDLYTGGAEMMLYKVLSAGDRSAFPAEVVVLTGPSALTNSIRELGVTVTHLNINQGHLPNPIALTKLFQTIKRFDPLVVQGWMYHGNLAAWLASRYLPARRFLVWNHRQTLYDIKRQKKMTRLIIEAEIRLSHQVDVLINNSRLSLHQHMAKGYRPQMVTLIPNGFDLQTFHPDRNMAISVREELGLAPTTLLTGLVGRDHPNKDLSNFLKAAARVHESRPDAVFLVVGRGWSQNDPGPAALIKELKAGQYIRLLGPRTDIPRLMAAFDITVSSSSIEGFPNVIGESMSAGTPCVVTDAGDSGAITGDTGLVVPRFDSEALAGGILEMLDLPEKERRDLGQRARRRVESHYSLPAIVGQYEDLYRNLVASHRR